MTLTQSELKHDIDTERLAESIHKAKQLCERAKTKYGLPGLSIAVAVNGINRFTEGELNCRNLQLQFKTDCA